MPAEPIDEFDPAEQPDGAAGTGALDSDATVVAEIIDDVAVEVVSAAHSPAKDRAAPASPAESGAVSPAASGREERLRAAETALGYTFFDKTLLKNALTHSSSTLDKRLHNERLEFFGDAVLDLVVREHLFHAYPNRREGDLTEAKSALVCRDSLAAAAKRMNLASFLTLGRGIGKKRGIPESLLADAYEAIVAAVYLDGGYTPAQKFILATLRGAMPAVMEEASRANYKSNLQNFLQQSKRPLPEYRVLSASGPEHSRTFLVAVVVGGEELGRGEGASKKVAEQLAARRALEQLGA